jgi:D-alanine-D-alanine ligase
MMRKNIAIIMGGYSSEREISLKSGQVVQGYLEEAGYATFPVDINTEEWVYLSPNGAKIPVDRSDFSIPYAEGKIQFDCVFNAVHGTPGEDGLIQAYFELLHLPHTSCSSYTSALTFNKRDLLSTLSRYGIPSAASVALNQGDEINTQAIVAKVGLPCFVKANRAGSSFGISKVYKEEDLPQAIALSFEEDDQVLIEAFLDGTEVSVGVIPLNGKPTALPITEIVSENDFFDYKAKYEGQSQEITPARIDLEMQGQIEELAERIYKLLNAKGFCRSEFIIVDRIPYLLEVNTTPGLTEESILPQQAQCAGISLKSLFSSAVENALNEVKAS